MLNIYSLLISEPSLVESVMHSLHLWCPCRALLLNAGSVWQYISHMMGTFSFWKKYITIFNIEIFDIQIFDIEIIIYFSFIIAETWHAAPSTSAFTKISEIYRYYI